MDCRPCCAASPRCSPVGEDKDQFVNWALTEGPFGLDPEEGF
jgi:hypothetical protein